MIDRFAILLADLGALINVPLHPDHKRTCKLNIDNQLHIQIEEEETKDRILVATFICEIPPGKFREKVFGETLKENSLYPRLGTFAYSARNNKLAFYSYTYYPGLNGDNFADFLGTFIEKALTWKTAVETGQLPQRGQTLQKVGPSIFDIQKK
jgi:hypothetical protein